MKKADILAAASVANVCFAYEWAALLNRSEDFYRQAPPVRNLVVLTIGVSLVAAAVLVARWVIQRLPGARPFIWWMPWLPLVIPASIWIQRLAFAFPRLGTAVIVGAWVAVGVGALACLRGYGPRLESAIRTATLLISPLILINLVQAFVLPIVYPRQPRIAAAPPAIEHHAPAHRLVLLLFDEMDQLKAFARRPADLRLDQLDALRDEAISADNAYAPATDTVVSVPSYLFGRRISAIRTTGFNDAVLRDRDSGETFAVSERDNLFATAAAAGIRTAVIGWYLPYCRVFPGPAACSWQMGDKQAYEQQGAAGDLLVRQIRRAAQDFPWLGRYLTPRRDAALDASGFDPTMFDHLDIHIQSYERVMADAKAQVANPGFDFVWVHLPVPHWPVVFDRRTGTWATQPSADYFSSLALADKALGEIRATLEGAGQWDETSVLAIADHGLIERPSDDALADRRRVPFLLKMAGQRTRVSVPGVFDTVLIHDLVLQLLRGPAMTPAEVVAWIETHRVDPNPPPGDRRP